MSRSEKGSVRLSFSVWKKGDLSALLKGSSLYSLHGLKKSLFPAFQRGEDRLCQREGEKVWQGELKRLNPKVVRWSSRRKRRRGKASLSTKKREDAAKKEGRGRTNTKD